MKMSKGREKGQRYTRERHKKGKGKQRREKMC